MKISKETMSLLENVEIQPYKQSKKKTIAKIKIKRIGDTIHLQSELGLSLSLSYLEIKDLMCKLEEELILEKMTDKEFTRFKKVVDSEWMRRKYNGNK